MLARNHFDVLNSSQEPSQIIAQATGAAKNRRKKEKAKARKANLDIAKNVKNGEQICHSLSDLENQKAAGQKNGISDKVSAETLQQKLYQESQSKECPSIWEAWLRMAKSNAKYVDAQGNAVSFQEVLRCSNALPKSMGNAVYPRLVHSDRERLNTLLSTCLSAPKQTCHDLATVVFDVNRQLAGAMNDTKVTVAALIEEIFKSFVSACESSAESGIASLSSLDEQIAAKKPLLQKAVSQPDTVQSKVVEIGMDVVQLMLQRFEGERCLASGLVRPDGVQSPN